MPMTPFRPQAAFLLAVPALLFAGVAFGQDKPDRPPWAQTRKSTTSANPTSKIDRFEPETPQPLDLATMIDSSMSAHKEISFEQEAAAHFIRQVLRPGDRLAVFAFDENVTQLASFSDNVAELQSAVRKMPAGA